MVSISIAITDFFVDGHNSGAVLNASVTDFGCEVDETVQLNPQNRDAEERMWMERETRAGSWSHFLGPSQHLWIIWLGTEMVWMTKLKDTEGVKWRRDEERRARVITYLNLSLKIVLREWKVEGSSVAFCQGGSEDTVEDFHVSGDCGRSGTDFRSS